MKIFLDPGHGGKDGGANNKELIEKNMNLETAFICRKRLNFMGFEVMLSRETDVYLGLTDRCKLANKWGADLLVSCHYNAGGGARGEVIHSVQKGAGLELAKIVANYLFKIGQPITKVYSKPGTLGSGDYFTVISASNMPAIIIEPCFIDNIADRKLADNPNKRVIIGEAIADAIYEYIMGYPYKSVASTKMASYDAEVNALLSDGIITAGNMVNWEKLLLIGNKVPSEDVRALIQRYHVKIK